MLQIFEYAGLYWVTQVSLAIGLPLIIAPHLLLLFFPGLARLSNARESAIRWFLIAMWALLNVPLLWRVWSGLLWRGDHPLALYAAARQPLLPVILRPFVAAWWLGHFAIAIWLGTISERAISYAERTFSYAEGGTSYDPMIAPMMFLFITFCCAYASNIFLIHAVTALTRGTLVQKVWNWRGACDAGLVIVGLLWKWVAQQTWWGGH
jgi:hypothetical protein